MGGGHKSITFLLCTGLMVKQKFPATEHSPENIFNQFPVIRIFCMGKFRQQFVGLAWRGATRKGHKVNFIEEFCIGYLWIQKLLHAILFCSKGLVNRVAICQVSPLQLSLPCSKRPEVQSSIYSTCSVVGRWRGCQY